MICDKEVIKAVRSSEMFSNEEKVIALICWLNQEDDFDLDDIDEDGNDFQIENDIYKILDQEEVDDNIDSHNEYLIEYVKEELPDHLKEYLDKDAYIRDNGADEDTMYQTFEWQDFEIDGENYLFNIISD